MIKATYKYFGTEYSGVCMGMCMPSRVGNLIAILVDGRNTISWVPEEAHSLDQVNGYSELSFYL